MGSPSKFGLDVQTHDATHRYTQQEVIKRYMIYIFFLGRPRQVTQAGMNMASKNGKRRLVLGFYCAEGPMARVRVSVYN